MTRRSSMSPTTSAPRAMSPKIKGFVQPKSWFVDFSPVSMTP